MAATLLSWANHHFVVIYIGMTVATVAFVVGQSWPDKEDAFGRGLAYGIAFPFMVLLCGGVVLILLDKIGI